MRDAIARLPPRVQHPIREFCHDQDYPSYEEVIMLNEMCWLAPLGTNGTKILHLRTAPNTPWRPYTAFPHLAVPDYQVPGGSKGWATYQKLMKAGWKLLPSTDTNSVLSTIKAG